MTDIPSTMPGCPVSPVIVAVRLAKTPLAIADAQGPEFPILFANDAFGALLGEAPAALAGRSLRELAAAMPECVLSSAPVAGADGASLCLLCSLVDARGEGADAEVARDAALLAEVARAASDLMKESGIAAVATRPRDHDQEATRIAREAVERATQADDSPPAWR